MGDLANDVDPDVLRRLHRDIGSDAALTTDLVDTYRLRSVELVATLVEACAANDAERVRTLAHDLKSTSAMVGAERLRSLAVSIERCGDECAEVRSDVATVERTLHHSLDVLRDLANSL
ncbi:MAG: Hpt domain-containing protein [Acidimicrobiales bacterium]